jgi:hypothetical protein
MWIKVHSILKEYNETYCNILHFQDAVGFWLVSQKYLFLHYFVGAWFGSDQIVLSRPEGAPAAAPAALGPSPAYMAAALPHIGWRHCVYGTGGVGLVWPTGHWKLCVFHPFLFVKLNFYMLFLKFFPSIKKNTCSALSLVYICWLFCK